MKKFVITITLLTISIILVSINGCTETTPNLSYDVNDTLGNGDDDDDNSPWILEGPVTYSAGILIAENLSVDTADSTVARCTLREAVDFGEVAGVIYTWRELVGGDAEYEMFIGGDTSRMTSLLIEQGQGDIQRALIAFNGSFSAPLYSRFEFKLPASSSVQIQNYQAEGE